MGDSAFWNVRFRDMERSLREPDPCLQEEADCFADCDRILDLACGDGRNSIFLARLGKEITAVDFSEEALCRLNHYADQEGFFVKTLQIDLSSDEILTLYGCFDGIIINHYRLDPQYFPHILSLLKNGGLLWINGFRETPTDSSVITEVDVLSPSDFSALSSCSLLNRREHETNQRKFVRYLWKK